MTPTANYLNKEGKIKCWPAKREGKHTVVRHLASKFETGRFYTEKEVNRIVEENHVFGDYFLLRRELIEHGYLERLADGSKYWRGGLWPKMDCVKTERLTIRRAATEDFSDIKAIYESCGYIGQWTGMLHDEDGLRALLGNTDLPPGGSTEFSYLAMVRAEDGKAVGFAQYYTAWPEPGCMWIGLFLLDPGCQKLGYGGEFVKAFLDECRSQGYRRAGLGVALRNQPALKFWVKRGFNRILKVTADGEAGEGSLGLLGLAMEL